MELPSSRDVVNRRRFIQRSGKLAGAAALLSAVPKNIFAADDSTIRLALIGCGGRGAGAVRDALSVPNRGPVKLWAVADLHTEPIQQRLTALRKNFPKDIEVPAERQFLGFDAYRHAIDTLQPGDVAMCTTRSYIRPYHVEYAVRRGINVFMEKPFASDPAGLHRLLQTAKEADEQGVKIAAGLQCRHSPARQALIERIRDGKLGDIPLIRANRLGSAGWLRSQGDKALDFSSQLNFGRIHLFWVGSGHMVDNLIHQIDECCWIKDAWPISCVAMGGRDARSVDCGQNLAVYSMEYTFSDGTKAHCGFRRQQNTRSEFATFIHGTRRAAQFSGQTHRATVHEFKDQRIGRDHIAWTPPADAVSPWQYEWNRFIGAIRKDLPYNEAKRAVYSDFTTLMGRAATHTGIEVTWNDMMNSSFQFCDPPETLNYDSTVPVKPDAEGHFPVPSPGHWTEV